MAGKSGPLPEAGSSGSALEGGGLSPAPSLVLEGSPLMGLSQDILDEVLTMVEGQEEEILQGVCEEEQQGELLSLLSDPSSTLTPAPVVTPESVGGQLVSPQK